MSKTLFFLFTFISILKILKCQNVEQLQKFIDCVNKTENIPSNLRNQILNAWLESDGSIYRVIGELLLTQNNHMKK